MSVHKAQKQNYRNFWSRMAGKLANTKKPKWFVKYVIRRWTKHYKIDFSEYVVPEKGFKNFNAFFTRHLKEGVRKISDGVVSPVDGVIFDFGKITGDHKIYVKFKHYYIDDLICDTYEEMNSYTVLYLSPSNYHRVHACFDMEITDISYLPGTLHSVKPKVVFKKDSVYCRNERIVIHGKSEYGNFYMILVGALFVGKTKLSFDSGLETNIKKGEASKKTYETNVRIKKGDEVGYFEMGSSVILLMKDDRLSKIKFPMNSPIQMGDSLA
ncbi:MAG: phosphatidylserine decarboxylase [Bacteroidales bacterium]|nr:phosphatidylserine decarboxylase [Bacteroidales bacterium]